MPEDAPASLESSIPVVDLRALDQDELLHLAASQLQVSLELVDISIDRSMFNESKEPTFSPPPPDRRQRAIASSSNADANGGKAMNLAEEAELARHLAQLDGCWVSQRKKQKIIAAKGFPQGWTVRVRLCFRGGRCFLNYHNYTSPEGKSWPSFKSASEYLVARLLNKPPDDDDDDDDGDHHQQQQRELLRDTREVEEEPPAKASSQQNDEQQHGSGGSENRDSGKPLAVGNVKWTERGFECAACGKCFRKKSQCVGHQMIHAPGKRKRGEPASVPVPANGNNDTNNNEDDDNNNSNGEKIDEAPAVVAERRNVEEEQQRQQQQEVRSSSSPELESCQVCKKTVMENPVYCTWCEREYHPDCVQAPIQRDWTCVICNFVA